MGTCDLCDGMGVVGYNGKAFIPEEQCPECDGTGAQEKYSRSSNHIQGDEIMNQEFCKDLDDLLRNWKIIMARVKAAMPNATEEEQYQACAASFDRALMGEDTTLHRAF